MGCDIHLHTEVKINGVWEHYSYPSVGRNYAVFAKMAGVRDSSNGIKPISLPKGIPDDATSLTKFDFAIWGLDAHSASWLSATEISELYAWINDNPNVYNPTHNWMDFESAEIGYLFGNSFDIIKYPEDAPKDVEDVRFVFWFDN